MSLRIGIDVGGTFTDAVVVDSATGAVLDAFKLPSTPADPGDAVILALRRIETSYPLQDAHVSHGTTVGTNTLIERRGARVALVATRGFRDVIELRRQARPELYTFDTRLAEPLVPADRRLEVDERTAFDGSVVGPLPDLGGLLEALRETGADAVAVSLLNAYAGPAHEASVAAAIRDAFPGLFVSVSSEIAPEIREYERTSTAVVNAYIGPAVRGYIARLDGRVRGLGARGLGIVKSSGGVTSPANAARYPVHLIESGPAAGLMAAAAFGTRMGRPDVLAFDVGGTTAKAGVVLAGEPRRGSEFCADALADGRPQGGYPILSPVVDIVEIGAGGGSIAFLDEAGILKVGPRSAGAHPGPACYGLGGRDPTLTDAHAVLGTLAAEWLAPAGVTLRPDLAQAAIRDALAEPLGWTVERAAAAIVEIAVANMAEMVRLCTVRRGLDPRDLALVASGGAGPLHAVAVAREVGFREVLVPPLPGMFSALGALLAPVRHDLGLSVLKLARDVGRDDLDRLYRDLGSRAALLLAAETDIAGPVRLARRADMRFRGQLFELSVELGPDGEPLPEGHDLAARFRRRYVAEYGFDLPDAVPELVAVRLTATAEPRAFGAAPTPPPCGDAGPRPSDSFRSVIGRDGATVRARLVVASAHPAGRRIGGPALVATGGATVWLPDGDTADLLPDGTVRISLGADR